MKNTVHFDDIKQIYDRLEDELSKLIFGKRMLYNMTGDCRYIHDIISTTDEGKEFIRRLSALNSREIYIFGAGMGGGDIVTSFPDIRWTGFIDNKPESHNFCGMPCIGLNEFLETHKSASVVISSKKYHNEMYNQLKALGIGENQIIDAGYFFESLDKKDYLELPELAFTEQESVVDCGGFDGLSLLNCIRFLKGKYDAAYLFEPESECMKNCYKNLSDFSRINYIEKGVWSESGFLKFDNDGGCIRVTDENADALNLCLPVTSLDEELMGKTVTYIKMDIEGAEIAALTGAENIIRKQKPKLGIRIYHKKDDLWSIPKLILQYNPEYKLYIRHYSLTVYDTILFAVN